MKWTPTDRKVKSDCLFLMPDIHLEMFPNGWQNRGLVNLNGLQGFKEMRKLENWKMWKW
jgi:hypothetical protein